MGVAETLILIFGLASIFILSWIYFLSFVCVFLDPGLDRFQKVGQILLVLLVPIVGSVLVLYIVNTHSPEVIKRFYIPWPFRNVVLGKERRLSKSYVEHDDFIEPINRKISNRYDDYDA